MNNLDYAKFKTLLQNASTNGKVLDLGVPIHRTVSSPLDLSSIIYLSDKDDNPLSYSTENEFRTAAREALIEKADPTWYPGQQIAVVGKINGISHIISFILQPQDHTHTDYGTEDGAVNKTETTHTTFAQELVYKPSVDLISADVKQLRNQIGGLTSVMNFRGVVQRLPDSSTDYAPGDIIIVQRPDGTGDSTSGINGMEYIYVEVEPQKDSTPAKYSWVELGFGSSLIKFINGDSGLQIPESLVGGTPTAEDTETLLEYIQAADTELATQLGILDNNTKNFSLPKTAFKVEENTIRSLVDYIKHADNTLAKFILGSLDENGSLSLPEVLNNITKAKTPDTVETLVDYIQEGDTSVLKIIGAKDGTFTLPNTLPTGDTVTPESILDYIQKADNSLKDSFDDQVEELNTSISNIGTKLGTAEGNISALQTSHANLLSDLETLQQNTKTAIDTSATQLTRSYQDADNKLQLNLQQKLSDAVLELAAEDLKLNNNLGLEKQARLGLGQELRDQLAGTKSELLLQDETNKAIILNRLDEATEELSVSLEAAQKNLSAEDNRLSQALGQTQAELSDQITNLEATLQRTRSDFEAADAALSAYYNALQSTQVIHADDLAKVQRSISQINASLPTFADQAEVQMEFEFLNTQVEELNENINAKLQAEEEARLDADKAIRDTLGSGFNTSTNTVSKKIDNVILTALLDATTKSEGAKADAIAEAEAKDEVRAAAAAIALSEAVNTLKTQLAEGDSTTLQTAVAYTTDRVTAEEQARLTADTAIYNTLGTGFDDGANTVAKTIAAEKQARETADNLIYQTLGEGFDTSNSTVAKKLANGIAEAKAYAEAKDSALKIALEGGEVDSDTTPKTIKGAKDFASKLDTANRLDFDAWKKDHEADHANKQTVISKSLSDETTAREKADKALSEKIGTVEDSAATATVYGAITNAKQTLVGTDNYTSYDSKAYISTIGGAKDFAKALYDKEVIDRTNVDSGLDERLARVEAFFGTADKDGEDTTPDKTVYDALDTLKEIQDYLTGDGTAADHLLDTIDTIKSTLGNADSFNTSDKTVAKTIAAAQDAAEQYAETQDLALKTILEGGEITNDTTAKTIKGAKEFAFNLDTANRTDFADWKQTHEAAHAAAQDALAETLSQERTDRANADKQINQALGVVSNSPFFSADNSVYDNIIFPENLTLTYKFGKYEPDSTGSFILPCAGKNIQEVLLDAFAQEVYEGLIISTPSASFTTVSGSASNEVGEKHGNPKVTLDLNISGSYKYGAKNSNNELIGADITATQAEIKYNNEVVVQMDNTNPNKDLTYEHTLTDDAQEYKDTVDTYKFYAYAASGEDTSRPLTNLGNFVGKDANNEYFGTKDFAQATGQIAAKTLLNAKEISISYTGYRKMFMGTVATSPSTVDSTFIRGLKTISTKAAKGAQEFTVSAGQKSFYVAIPMSLTTATPTFKYKFFGNWEALQGVTVLEDTIDVEGANGYETKPYKVYVYTPATGSFDAATDIQVTVN